jgi:hypothetical protein
MAPTAEYNALQRLLAIRWRFDQSKLESHVALMREYLRRAALWSKSLQAADHWPFFDVASLIAPKVRADPSLVSEFEKSVSPLALWPTVRKTCIWYLHWNAVKESQAQELAKHNLPEPFDPLIRLYERGGQFQTEHGFINVGLIGITARFQGWQAYNRTVPVVDLDDDSLDRVDAKTTGAA